MTPVEQSGRLAVNVMHFSRVLRAAGLPVGTGAILDALSALAVIDIHRRDDTRAALASVLVKKRQHRELFDQAFDAYFRDPFRAENALCALLSQGPGEAEPAAQLSRRVAEAMQPRRRPTDEEQPRPLGLPEQEELEIDAALTFSEREVLGHKDFAAMSAEELARARAVVARMRLCEERVPSRRHRPGPSGPSPSLDLRATLRAAVRSSGHDIPLCFRSRRLVPPPLVVLCDISGSMARYSEMLLRFLHAVVSGRRRVHTFLFGTRLSNVTRALRFRDVDVALARCSAEVKDWSGGTRIGASLREFNRAWSRRVLGQGAIVLFITDGLDRDGADGVAAEMERLARSCRRLVWLNPLLGYEGFEPRAAGIRALLPWVDEFRPVHNLESLEQLAAALADAPVTPTPEARAAVRHHDKVRRLRRG